MSERAVNVAVVGATGAVGGQILRQLELRKFPVGTLKCLASQRSAGQTVSFDGAKVTVEEATPQSFSGVDVALFSAGGSVSKQLVPHAVASGAVAIDNTNAYRMNPDVPLVVPEVNSEKIKEHKGIISNPNCSTIQMVVALKPLVDRYGVKRVIVSTYQAVSGAGNSAIDALMEETRAALNGEAVSARAFPVGKLERHYQMAFNAIPQIDVPDEGGYTLEEMKMVRETKKIFGDESLAVTATCVRIPVATGHSESVYVELATDYDLDDVRQLLADTGGVTVIDDIAQQAYPMPLDAAGRDDVFVGRLRRDLDQPRALNMWVVADNLLKGAALNTVQIAEHLVKSL
ncbi:aspartate-semialdehyde dehydrogenase [Numidum massiliense]|uniref:aspartate-semialdehyde dehydrogenase n=1 Tax=Numidum massiliense TaxID=1522315 RepID=UPI0006D58E6C|nr:aspartate-semialdehyde dehydrogenase [Numidum massiliense]